APDRTEFSFILEKLRQLAEQHFYELVRGHRRAVWMPKRCAHHVLDGAVLAIGKFDLDLLPTLAGFRFRPRWFGLRRSRDPRLPGFWLYWLTIPFGIVEVM